MSNYKNNINIELKHSCKPSKPHNVNNINKNKDAVNPHPCLYRNTILQKSVIFLSHFRLMFLDKLLLDFIRNKLVACEFRRERRTSSSQRTQ